jgi:hypothetical protein
LLSSKKGKLVRYFSLALFAGIRPGGELAKLAKSPQLVDLDNKVIRITAAMAKTRKSRQITIRPNLLKWLKRFEGDILPANASHEFEADPEAAQAFARCTSSHVYF